MGDMQLSMMDVLCPPPPEEEYVPIVRRDVITNAYGKETRLQLPLDAPDPVEVMIRNIPCLVVWDFGASIYATQPCGSLFWSETGYRSMAHSAASIEQVIELVEAYIDAPKAKCGLGGRPKRWWPLWVLQWQQSLAFILQYGQDRSKLWAQWGPERHAEIWSKRDAEHADALNRMRKAGIDPNEVGPPDSFKGKWPQFTV